MTTTSTGLNVFADMVAWPPRDKWGRPLLEGPDGKVRPYFRASGVGDKVDTDKDALIKWGRRLVARGALRTVEGLAQVAEAVGTEQTDDQLNLLAESLFLAGGGDEQAAKGTQIHKVIEAQLLGEPLPEGTTPEDLRDADAYHKVAKELGWRVFRTEQFVAYDAVGINQIGGRWEVGGIAGSADEYGQFVKPMRGLPEGVIVGDYKTGLRDPGAFNGTKYSFQLGVYANAQIPRPGGVREPIADEPVNKQWAVIWHIPAGSGECNVRFTDIGDFGLQVATLSMMQRVARKGKKAIGGPHVQP